MKNGKDEFEKLLTDKVVNDNLINHPQFKSSFIYKYNKLSGYNVLTRKKIDGISECEVIVSENTVILKAVNHFPNLSNGSYHGLKVMNVIEFQIEQVGKINILSERSDSYSLYSFPDKDQVVTIKELNSYIDSDEVVYYRCLCMRDFKKNTGDIPGDLYDFRLNAEYAFTGRTIYNDLLEKQCDFMVYSLGRKKGSSVATTTNASHKGEESIDQIGLVEIDSRKKLSTSYRGNDFYYIDRLKKSEYLDPKYTSKEDAILKITQKYSQSDK